MVNIANGVAQNMENTFEFMKMLYLSESYI